MELIFFKLILNHYFISTVLLHVWLISTVWLSAFVIPVKAVVMCFALIIKLMSQFRLWDYHFLSVPEWPSQIYYYLCTVCILKSWDMSRNKMMYSETRSGHTAPWSCTTIPHLYMYQRDRNCKRGTRRVNQIYISFLYGESGSQVSSPRTQLCYTYHFKLCFNSLRCVPTFWTLAELNANLSMPTVSMLTC